MKPSVTLKENYEFRRLYQRGASAVGGSMVIYCRKNRLGHNRLGLTASVKLGNAVKRNRARRRLREVYRLNSSCLKQGWDLVLVARGRTLSASWKDLNDTFLRLCRKLDLLQDLQTRLRGAQSEQSAQKNPEKRDGLHEKKRASAGMEDKP